MSCGRVWLKNPPTPFDKGGSRVSGGRILPFSTTQVGLLYLYLSRELNAEKNEERRTELIEAIRNGSVVAWRHFNLHGEFNFSDERMVDSVGFMVPEK